MRLSPTTVFFALCGALAGPLSGSASAQAARVDLSPVAAARTVGQDWQVESAAPTKAPAADEGEEGVLAASIDGLVRADRESRGQARDRGATGVLWSAMRPWKGLQPLLHKVRYWYVGRGIDATIADDGSVAFHDKDGVVAAPLPLMDRFGPGGRPNTESANGGSPSSGGRIRGSKLSPGIGISDAARLLRRRVAHEDPHAIERADFLERTRALRDWLSARTRDRDGERATQDMLHELARIWSAAASLTTTQQQEQTFCDLGRVRRSRARRPQSRRDRRLRAQARERSRWMPFRCSHARRPQRKPAQPRNFRALRRGSDSHANAAGVVSAALPVKIPSDDVHALARTLVPTTRAHAKLARTM